MLLIPLIAATVAFAGDMSLKVEPESVRLDGSDARAQLIVTGQSGAKPFDLTTLAVYASRNPSVAQVGPDGLVVARGDGEGEIEVRSGSETRIVRVGVTDFANTRPVSFEADVQPILTRHGCNAGGCHGKASGQNGFRLSLLGFDPRMDHDAIVREARGRRVLIGSPSESLFLLKPTARLPHGGGKKFDIGSPEFRTIERWIRQGAGRSGGKSAELASLRVEPGHRIVGSGQKQQVRVVANYSDGRSADVTRLAQYQSNAGEIADVEPTGLIQAREGVGEAAIMARFGGQVAVARVVVPLKNGRRAWAAPTSDNLIDPLVFGKLRELGLEPSPASTDAEFARRSSLDICGILPDPKDVVAFETDADPGKRAKWVDRLIDRPEYADLFALKWSAILKNKRSLGQVSQPATFAFHAWIRQAMAENMPYDRFAAAIIGARGDVSTNPPVAWYRMNQSAEERADDTAQLFLGQRIQCARCHHHPFERWSQDDYYGFASIFSRIGTKPGFDPTTPRIFLASRGMAKNPMTDKPQPPKPLGSPELAAADPRKDPRADLVSWLKQADNPFFARALVNRYWKHFLGRGLVEPEDDMRVSNPPSNPEVLDALSAAFVKSGYDLRWLVRTITTSKVYDRSSLPNETNEADRRNFARSYPRRLPAEVLLDAINRVTGSDEKFLGLPLGSKATQLPDDGFASYFLDVFGRPKRESVCECERSAEANLSQTLHLLNSEEIQRKLTSDEGRAARFASEKDPRSGPEKVTELYRLCVSRGPTPEELRECVEFLGRRRAQKQPRQGYEDLIWTLINTKEFLFQ